MNRNLKFIMTGALSLVFLLGLRYCFYGSVETCSYSEAVVKLSPTIAQSTIRFTKQAAIVRGVDTEYVCLPEMGKITNKIVPAVDAENYRFQIEDAEIDLVDASSGPELLPAKLVIVTKHGAKALDSGSGPIHHLILKDKEGNLYEVATVSLGLNEGDEFLKAVTNEKEIILSPSTKFSE